MNEQDTATRRGFESRRDELDEQVPPGSPLREWFREWLYGEPDNIETDLALAKEGHFHLIPQGSAVFMLNPYSEIFSQQIKGQGLFRDPHMILRYVFLFEKGVAPSLQLPPEELLESMDNAARTHLASCGIHTSLSSDTMWGILRSHLEDQALSYIFTASEAETEPKIPKNFPLGEVFGEITVSGLGKRMDPIQATKALIGGLIGKRKESLLAAEQVFDKDKLAQARHWIANSDLAPEKLFREIRPHLERGDVDGARQILEYFAQIPNHAVNDLVSGVLGLFNGEETFSRLEFRMQDGTFADMFDNTRLMSCTFLPSGMYAGASFRYQFDPDIGLLHIVPTSVDKKLNPIGVAILVNAVDQSGNKWLVVDSVEGGLDLERVRDSLWIQTVYQAILSVARAIGARYVLFNNKVYNGGRPKRFLEYVAKRHPSGEPILEKMGLQNFSYPGVPPEHINEALETWGGKDKLAAPQTDM